MWSLNFCVLRSKTQFRNIMNKLWTSFKKFLMSNLSARLNLVNFSPTKNLTSNGSKPIRVLTRTKSSCSDERIPIGYKLRKIQQIWRNFFGTLTTTAAANQEERGSTRGKTVPILVVDHSESFTMTKLLAIWFTAIFNHLLIKTKKSLENELQTIVCPEEFWHRKFPSFQKNYSGRSLIVPKQIVIWIPHFVQDCNGKKNMRKKNWIE